MIARVRCGTVVDEARQPRRTVHLSRLLLFTVERLQRGQQDQRGKRQPLPRHDHDDRQQRRLGQEIIGLQAQPLGDMGKHAIHRVHEHVLPDQGAHGRHHEERGDHQHPHDTLTPERQIHQQRQQHPANHRDQQHADHNRHGVPQGLQKRLVGHEVIVVGKPGPSGVLRAEQIVMDEAEIQRRRQGHDHPDEQHDDRGGHHQAGGKARMLGGHGAPPKRDMWGDGCENGAALGRRGPAVASQIT